MVTISINSYIPRDLQNEFKFINYSFKNVVLHPIIDKLICSWLIYLTWLKMYKCTGNIFLKKSKRNTKYSSYPLNSKIIQDAWCLTRKNCKHRLMETKLSEKRFNKNTFLRMY